MYILSLRHPQLSPVLHDTNICSSLSMRTFEGHFHSDLMPWGRGQGLTAAAPEVLGLMELGRGPVFTFPLTEEAQDERAPLHTDTYHPHTHAHLTDKYFGRTRGQIIVVIESIRAGLDVFTFQLLLNEGEYKVRLVNAFRRRLNCLMLQVLS